MIYFIQQDINGPIKIGYTENNPESRLKALQTGNSNTLTLLGYIDGEEQQEKMIHRFFNGYRINGEWFRPDPFVMDYIFSLIFNQKYNFTNLSAASEFDLKKYLKEIELIIIQKTLKRFNNNKSKTARFLKITRKTLLSFLSP